MVSTVFAPGVPEVEKEFNSTSSAMSSLMVSIYVMGSAVGPLFLTPLTEVSGRLPMTHFANILFMIAAVVCAAAVNMPMLIIARLVMGVASSVPVTVGGGYIADLMPMERRGTAMTIWTVGPLMVSSYSCCFEYLYAKLLTQDVYRDLYVARYSEVILLRPLAGGGLCGLRRLSYVDDILTHFIIYISNMSQGAVVVIASLIFLRETYAPKILERKALRLHKATGLRYRTKYEQDKSIGRLMWISVTRPILFLCRSPTVLIVSLYSAVTYSYMYILFTTFTEVFETQYGFSPGQAGLGYLGLGLGFGVGQVTVGLFSDRHMKKQEAIYGKMKPEDRLPPLVLGCCLVPVGLFWYGWAAEYKLHWFVTIAGTFFVGLGIYYVHLVTQVYLVDAYTLYAASAVSAELCIRCVFGAVVPLAGPDLYSNIGLGWGNSILGFIAVAFAPTSFFLLKYGERIRTNPKFQPKLT